MDESSRPAGNGKTSPELSLYLDSSPLVFSDSLFEPDGGDAIAPYMDIGSDPAEREAIKLARNCERLAAAGPADIFLFASRTDTFGQVLLEAQASGLPVVAVAEGGPTSLVRHGDTGLLCPPDAHALANAVAELAAAPQRRAALASAALTEVRSRTWDAALARLADGYRRALSDRGRATPLPRGRSVRAA